MQYDSQPALPPADATSAAHSQRVAEHLRARIGDGMISFAEFMHEALYAPGLGYYSAGARKFGAAGDFVTAPEVSAVFGRLVAGQMAEVMANIDDSEVLEIGAGSGKLAADMLQQFERLDALPRRYNILEVSADLIQRQQALLRETVPHLYERVAWIPDWPLVFRGAVVANEILDAIPFERFVMRNGRVWQRCVRLVDDGFDWTEREAPLRLEQAVRDIEADLRHPLPDGYESDVSPAAAVWMAELADAVDHGAIFLFDYGVARREYYAADRAGGWLRCHFRHRAHNDPLRLPGIQDITTWVDFSAVAAVAAVAGLDILGYSPQAQFLLGAGLDRELDLAAVQSPQQQLALSGQVKTLTLPGEMGEHFKCMALGRGDVPTPSAFDVADRTQTL